MPRTFGVSGPGPIPNSEAKPSIADGTAPRREWESRTVPGNMKRLLGNLEAFRHFCRLRQSGALCYNLYGLQSDPQADSGTIRRAGATGDRGGVSSPLPHHL